VEAAKKSMTANKRLTVRAIKEVSVPQPGDTIIGRAVNVQGTFAIIEILAIGTKISTSSFVGLLYIARASNRARTMNDVLKAGDLVNAHVVAVNNGTIHLGMPEPSDGVFVAYCNRCGNVLRKVERNRLICESCGSREIRRVSAKYGEVGAVPLE
jgi:exosome complex RNA-binding protein Csl4